MNLPQIVPFVFGDQKYFVLDPGDNLHHVAHLTYVVAPHVDEMTGQTTYKVYKKELVDTGQAYATEEEAVKACISSLWSDWASQN